MLRVSPSTSASSKARRAVENEGAQHQEHEHFFAAECHPVAHGAGDPFAGVVVVEIDAEGARLAKLLDKLHQSPYGRCRADDAPTQEELPHRTAVADGREDHGQHREDVDLPDLGHARGRTVREGQRNQRTEQKKTQRNPHARQPQFLAGEQQSRDGQAQQDLRHGYGEKDRDRGAECNVICRAGEGGLRKSHLYR